MVVFGWIRDGLWMAFQMAWEVWWALVLGFLLSGIVQAWVPRSRMEQALGGRSVVVVQLRRDRDCEVDVREGRELRDRDGFPIRVDEPRLRDRDCPLGLH